MIVIVTGASRGIGRATVLACAKQGAHIFAHHIGDKASTADIASLRAEVVFLGRKFADVTGDISDPNTASKVTSTALEKFGRIDVLVSNAGICAFTPFLDVTTDIWHKHFDTNIHGTFYIVQSVAKVMKSQTPQGGSIICVSSISALVGGGEQCHYTPTKAAIMSLMQSCAIALGPHGIRCNAVLPGTIETDINKEDLADRTKREYMEKRTPLGRLGRPEDLGGPIVFLASDMAGYVTGTGVLVDGGMFVNLQ
ncbi:hypothetical protein YB2330_001953 [Saitoella coloradoensis]